MHKYIDHDWDYVLHQRLLIEEYGVELKYIKGKNNEAADALSQFDCNHVVVIYGDYLFSVTTK